MVLDVSSTASIKYFAEQFIKATIPPLHAIVCNAGAGFAKGTQVTADGVEATFGVNHLGHFLLVRLLLNQIEEQGRIIIVSSDTHDPSKKTGMPAPRYASPDTLAEPVASDQLLANLSDLSKGQIRYTTSKLCNLYFTYELTNRIRKSKRSISIVTFNPGMMPSKGSALTRNYKPFNVSCGTMLCRLCVSFTPAFAQPNNRETILQTLLIAVLLPVERIGTVANKSHLLRNLTIKNVPPGYGIGVLKGLTWKRIFEELDRG